MNITLLTNGSRGDVQPFLALAIALRERGHSVKVVAPNDFETLAAGYGIPYRAVPLDVRGLADMNAGRQVTDKGITPRTLLAVWREVIPALKRAFLTATDVFAEESRDADLIIAHGFLVQLAYSIHEHLQKPLILAIAAPMVSTRQFPSPAFPSIRFAQRYFNPFTYRMLVRSVTFYMIEAVNDYRRRVGLTKLSNGKVIRLLCDARVPVTMHYSRHLGPVASDWSDNVHVTGMWNLPAPDSWQPPDALSTFLEQGDPPVFFGFGSMTVGNPVQTSRTISEALRLTNLRGVLQAGWAGLAHEDDRLVTIGDAPHEWLFPQMAAIVHHGGSGTTHSAASAGKPSLTVPVMADQPFWGRRLVEHGVGVPSIAPKKLTPETLAAALRQLTQDETMKQRSAELGKLLRAEDGLAATCDLVERYGT